MGRYLETWVRHNSQDGLTNRSIGLRQSGLSYLAYIFEHPKVAGLVYTRKGELNKRFHKVAVTWRGRCPL